MVGRDRWARRGRRSAPSLPISNVDEETKTPKTAVEAGVSPASADVVASTTATTVHALDLNELQKL